MPSSEIGNENRIIASFNEVPEEFREAYDRQKKEGEEKELQEFLSCFDKDRRGVVFVNTPIVFPTVDTIPTVSTSQISNASNFTTPKDVTGIIVEFTKHIGKSIPRMVQENVVKVIIKLKLAPEASTSQTPPPQAISNSVAASAPEQP
jgi:hypothetical protein